MKRDHKDFCEEVQNRKNCILKKRAERRKMIFACVPFLLCAGILTAVLFSPNARPEVLGSNTTQGVVNEVFEPALEQSPEISAEYAIDYKKLFTALSSDPGANITVMKLGSEKSETVTLTGEQMQEMLELIYQNRSAFNLNFSHFESGDGFTVEDFTLEANTWGERYTEDVSEAEPSDNSQGGATTPGYDPDKDNYPELTDIIIEETEEDTVASSVECIETPTGNITIIETPTGRIEIYETPTGTIEIVEIESQGRDDWEDEDTSTPCETHPITAEETTTADGETWTEEETKLPIYTDPSKTEETTTADGETGTEAETYPSFPGEYETDIADTTDVYGALPPDICETFTPPTDVSTLVFNGYIIQINTTNGEIGLQYTFNSKNNSEISEALEDILK